MSWKSDFAFEWISNYKTSLARLEKLQSFENALLERLSDPNLPQANLERIVGADDDATDAGLLGDVQREIRSLIRLLPLQHSLAVAAQVVLQKTRERRLKTDQIMISRVLARRDDEVSMNDLCVADDGDDLSSIYGAAQEAVEVSE